jgi:hypothetical protein
MAKLVGTVARVNPKTGIWEHKHEGSGWHWASAGHRDAGELHASVKATEPTFMEGTKAELKPSYLKAVNREPGYVSQIAGTKNDGKGVFVRAK